MLRKRTIIKLIADKRAKVIANKLEFDRHFNGEVSLEMTCRDLLADLFHHLEITKGVLDVEVYSKFNKIRNLVGVADTVEPALLNLLVTPKFLQLIIDFIKYGNEFQENMRLYHDSIREVLWICVNLLTTPFPEHESAIIESGLVEVLLDCFAQVSDFELSRDLLHAFMNFLLGSEAAVLRLRSLNAEKVFYDKCRELMEAGSSIPSEWLIFFCRMLALYIGAKPHEETSTATTELCMLLDFAMSHADESWENDLKSILTSFVEYLSAANTTSLQRLINFNFHRTLMRLLKTVNDDIVTCLVLGCLVQFKDCLDLEPVLQSFVEMFIQDNTEDFRQLTYFLKDRSANAYVAIFEFLASLFSQNAEGNQTLANTLLNGHMLESCFDIYLTTSLNGRKAVIVFLTDMVYTASSDTVAKHLEENSGLLDLTFSQLADDLQTTLTIELLNLLQALLYQDREFSRLKNLTERESKRTPVQHYLATREQVLVLDDLQRHFNRQVSELAYNTVLEYINSGDIRC